MADDQPKTCFRSFRRRLNESTLEPRDFSHERFRRANYPNEVEDAVNRLTLLTKNNIFMILNSVPNSIMSEVYKEWVLKLLLYRKDWINKWKDGRD